MIPPDPAKRGGGKGGTGGKGRGRKEGRGNCAVVNFR